MPHRVEIDQSNKIEDSGDTFLAFSNGISYTIRIPFRVKEKGIALLRQRGKSKRTATLMVFVACVFLLIEEHLGEIETIILDNEYDGRTADIRSFLFEYIKGQRHYIAPSRIVISSIGKKSGAHHLAWRAFRRRQPVDRTIALENLIAIIQ